MFCCYSFYSASKDADFFRFPQPKTLLYQKNNIGLYSPLVSTRQSIKRQSIRNRRNNNPTTIYHGVPSYLNPNLMRQRENRSKSVKSNDEQQNDDNIVSSDPLFIRSKSERGILYDKENKQSIDDDSNDFGDYQLKPITKKIKKNIGDNNNNDNNNNNNNNNNNKNKKGLFVQRSHALTVPNREDAYRLRRSYSYQELDDETPDANRERLRTEWSLYNDEHGGHDNPIRKLTQQELTVSYVKTAPQKR